MKDSHFLRKTFGLWFFFIYLPHIIAKQSIQPHQHPKMRKLQWSKGLAIVAIILAITAAGLWLQRTPAAISKDASPDVFSAERAATHLTHIATTPNPIGSQANVLVKNYILDQLTLLGLEPQVQDTIWYYSQRAASLSNVMVRIPGSSGSGSAILFLGHYDTVIAAPGAADNGAAVATLLEVIRMLRHHPPLKNDLIFVFTDGEEYGLLGAQAFEAGHPWADDVAMVVNLEAMGTSGQSIMFETGWNNLNTIRHYARAVPYATGNSLSVEIYNRMTNATDYDIFKQTGYPGLNFAFIGSSYNYHTAGDNIENTSLRSIQHHGEHAGALALYLGNADADFSADQNAVYFNTIGYRFVHYPYKWAPITGILALLASILVIALGIRKGMIRPWHGLFAFLALIIKMALLYVVFEAIFGVLQDIHGEDGPRLLQYNQTGLLLSFVLLATGISLIWYHMLLRGIRGWQVGYIFTTPVLLMAWGETFSWTRVLIALGVSIWLYLAHRKPISQASISGGAMAIWGLLAALSSFVVPGASYLFVWPLLFALTALSYTFYHKTILYRQWAGIALFVILALPLLLWYPQLQHQLILAMGPGMAATATILTGLMMALLLPQILPATRSKVWVATLSVMVAGLAALTIYGINPDFSSRHPKANSIFYALDGNTGDAYWLSPSGLDEWTSQFITSTPSEVPLRPFYPYHNGQIPGNSTPTIQFIPPTLEVLSDSIIEGERMLTFRVFTHMDAAHFSFHFLTEGDFLDIELAPHARQRLRHRAGTDWYWFFYYAPPDRGAIFTLYTNPNVDITVHLGELNFSDIPPMMNVQPRHAHMMSVGDRVIIGHEFGF